MSIFNFWLRNKSTDVHEIKKKTINVTLMPLEEATKTMKQICGSFDCDFSSDNIIQFSEPKESALFNIFSRTYDGYKTLRGSEPEIIKKPFPFKCDIMRKYIDEYGESVIVLIQEIPCFDSWDYMVDAFHSLYFFHNENSIAALYCQEGDQLSRVYVFQNIHNFDERLKGVLKDYNFPI